jgi:uncharacterized protein (DUF924 family)
MNEIEKVINFWFDEIDPANWWKKDINFDQMITDRFLAIHDKATQCELYEWRESPLGRVAEVIVLDQFSRNIHRNNALSFANDSLALCLAQEAVRAGIDRKLKNNEKAFLYMPFMHSESTMIHEIAVGLFSEPGLESNLDFELKHKQIIDQFGRFPHRNEILGRRSTPDEVKFLQKSGSSF